MNWRDTSLRRDQTSNTPTIGLAGCESLQFLRKEQAKPTLENNQVMKLTPNREKKPAPVKGTEMMILTMNISLCPNKHTLHTRPRCLALPLIDRAKSS